MSYVYFIHSPALNAVKIGYTSSDPRRRLAAMQTGNADALSLIGWCHGTIEEEHRWHMRFSSHCIRGEWFRLEGPVADMIRAFREHYWSKLGAEMMAL